MDFVRPTLGNLFALIASLPDDQAAAIMNAPLSHYRYDDSGKIAVTAGIGAVIQSDGTVSVDFDEEQNAVWILNNNKDWKLGTSGETNPLIRWPGFLNGTK